MDNFIFIKRKAFSEKDCKHLINHFEKNNLSHRDLKKIRGYTSVSDNLLDFPGYRDILLSYIHEYCSQHPFLGNLYFEWGIDYHFNIQKYEPEQAYRDEHMEHGNQEHDSKRLLGWMVYLNDIKYKGGTCWPQQRFTSRPRQGDLYIWPAAWTHSHYGVPAPKEIKYIATGWAKMGP